MQSPIQSKAVRGGDPSLAGPSPLENLHPFSSVSPYIFFHVLLFLVLATLYLSFGCGKRVVVYENPLDEPERAQVVQIFPDEEDPPALVQNCGFYGPGEVYFGFNESGVSEQGVKVVEGMAAYLRGCDSVLVKVEGYCDNRGSREYNYGLGQRRAGAVCDLLVSLGVEDRKMQAISYGEGGLVVTGCKDEGCHGKNRRVEFKIERVTK